MKPDKGRRPASRLKVRIPFLFEAEGEGVTPVLCLTVLAVLALAVFYLTTQH